VIATGAVNVPEPRMFTYDVSLTQVIVVEADAANSYQLFESK